MRAFRTFAAVATVAATGLAGAACETQDDAGSPGQEEAPADDTGGGEDDGLY
jgi:hypothetical protein